jgi:hypothetical protein
VSINLKSWFAERSHASIVRGRVTAPTGDWRLILTCINTSPV